MSSDSEDMMALAHRGVRLDGDMLVEPDRELNITMGVDGQPVCTCGCSACPDKPRLDAVRDAEQRDDVRAKFLERQARAHRTDGDPDPDDTRTPREKFLNRQADAWKGNSNA